MSEHILPSGKFLEIARPTAMHILTARFVCAQVKAKTKNEPTWVLVLATTLCKIDGQEVTYAELLELDCQDFIVLEKELERATCGPVVPREEKSK